jgi:hypothetical protein
MSKIIGYRSFVSPTLSLSLSLSLSHTHRERNIHALSRPLSRSRSLSPAPSFALPCSPSRTPPLSLTLPLSLSHTHLLPSSAHGSLCWFATGVCGFEALSPGAFVRLAPGTRGRHAGACFYKRIRAVVIPALFPVPKATPHPLALEANCVHGGTASCN